MIDTSVELEVTNYTISIVNGTGNQIKTVPADTTSVTFTGLPSGSYFNFSVYALNRVQGGSPRQTFITGMANRKGIGQVYHCCHR